MNRRFPAVLFVRLPERTATRLQKAAAAREQSVAEYVRQVLNRTLAKLPPAA